MAVPGGWSTATIQTIGIFRRLLEKKAEAQGALRYESFGFYSGQAWGVKTLLRKISLFETPKFGAIIRRGAATWWKEPD